jgi:hypothetical protein
VPGWLCGGSLHLGLGPVTEVGHNALHFRLGMPMTNAEALTERNRPAGVAWETTEALKCRAPTGDTGARHTGEDA